MVENNILLHARFKLNGVSYSKESLSKHASELEIKGKPFETRIGAFILEWLNGSTKIDVKTSGSTGTPKTIAIQKKQMVNSAIATGTFFNLKEGDTALLCLSAEYIAGKMMLVRAMVLGLAIDTIDPSALPLALNSQTYDFCAMVPLQLQKVLQQLHQFKTLIVGGAPMLQSLLSVLKDSSTNVYATYGMTETVTHIALKQISGVKDQQSQILNDVFIALPNVTYTQDERNCLIIDAPNVADNLVVTNDVVELLSNTSFKWLGRFDNIINSGGVKLNPEIIEQKLSKIITTRFFVAGVADDRLGQRLILIVEGNQNAKALLQKLNAESTLSRFEFPKKVYTLPKFMETKTGKILRSANLRLIQK